MNKTDIIINFDTSETHKINVTLVKKGVVYIKSSIYSLGQAQMVLSLFEKLLKEQQININEIEEIKVHTGPGSYTGIRVGVAVAQILGLLLSKKVNGKASGYPIELRYDASSTTGSSF